MRNLFFGSAGFAVVGLLLLSAASGQSRYAGDYYFPGYYSPSTAGESLARGRADVIRSQGQFLLDSSQAASQFEDARQKNIENRYRYTQAYFDLKAMNRQRREEARGPRPTEEQLVRWAQAGAPKPLSESQMNPHDGELQWPDALELDAFSANRKLVDQLAAQHVAMGRLNIDQRLQLDRALEEMRAGLKDRIKDFSPNTYLAGKNFLDSLDYQLTQ